MPAKQYIPTVQELVTLQRRLPIPPHPSPIQISLPLYREQFQKGHGFAEAQDNKTQEILMLHFESRAWIDSDGNQSYRWVYVGDTDMTIDPPCA